MKQLTEEQIVEIVNERLAMKALLDALEAKERECEQLKNEAIEHYKNCSAFPRNLSEEAFRLLESIGADKGPHGNTLAGMIQNVCEATEQLRRDRERLDWLDDVLQQGDIEIYSRLNLNSDSVDLRDALDSAMTKGEGK